MKTRILISLLVLSLAFQACNRAMTPYQAANNPKGKRCRDIR
ncbi:MAG TPA: hypothetical protein VET23_08085 [Chitinophagaceae bacterium]|nr:hypothetical protein [Chitinophagaceae bacterium]